MFGIGELASRSGVGVDALRYYERIGLMPRAQRSVGGQRRYGEMDLARLRFIRRAQAMNFSLAEIADLLSLRERSGDVRGEVRSMTEAKLDEIEARIAELTELRDEMRTLVEQCRASAGECPIIRRIAD